MSTFRNKAKLHANKLHANGEFVTAHFIHTLLGDIEIDKETIQSFKDANIALEARVKGLEGIREHLQNKTFGASLTGLRPKEAWECGQHQVIEEVERYIATENKEPVKQSILESVIDSTVSPSPQEPVPQWISVGAALPDENRMLDVWIEVKDNFRKESGVRQTDVLFRDGFFHFKANNLIYHVTHWQPIAPPITE